MGISDTNIPSVDDVPDLDWQNSSDNEIPDLADMGTNGNDILSGSTDVDLMIGKPGNDKIFGYNDDNMIFGGVDVTIISGSGEDLILIAHGEDESGVTIVKYHSEDDIILLTQNGAPRISNANGPLLTLEGDGYDVLIKYDRDIWARVEKGVGKVNASNVLMGPF